MTSCPASEWVDRFVRDLDSLAPQLDRLGVAVSGGPDSLALLLLAHAALPGRVEAATADHGLRAESALEAAFVAEFCAQLGVPHASLSISVDTRPASLQRSARQARYAALAAWAGERGLSHVATAHHADDQAETLLMRLMRGSGVGGLAGVRAIGPIPVPKSQVHLVRPLLGWRRSELGAIVEAAGVAPAEDPSNRDPRYDRVRMRTQIGETPWLDIPAIAGSAAALAEADEALGWVASELYDLRVSRPGTEYCFAHAGLPQELQRRLVRSILVALNPSGEPRGQELTRLLAALRQGRSATLVEVKCTGGETEWRFRRAPPRRSDT